jgi:hypothetical protein
MQYIIFDIQRLDNNHVAVSKMNIPCSFPNCEWVPMRLRRDCSIVSCCSSTGLYGTSLEKLPYNLLGAHNVPPRGTIIKPVGVVSVRDTAMSSLGCSLLPDVWSG